MMCSVPVLEKTRLIQIKPIPGLQAQALPIKAG
jgi:hypothetical protein